MLLFGAPDVTGLEARVDVKGLINALSYKSGGAHPQHEGVRTAAALALGRIGDDRATGPIVAALTGRESSSFLREAAASALGQIGSADAIAPLIGALRDDIKQVREAAAEALGKVGDARATEPLIAAFADPDRNMRLAVAEALGKIGDPRAAEALIEAFADSDQEIHQTAVKAVVRMGDAAVASLVAALRLPHGRVGTDAAGVIGVLVEIDPSSIQPLKGTVESLVACLDRRDPTMRKSAAQLLGKIGDARAKKALVETLSDGNPDVVQAAGEALAKLGWKPARSAAGAAFWVSQGEWGLCVKIGAIAVPSLVAALNDRHQGRRDGARQALVRIGAPAVEPLLDALVGGARPVRASAARALGEIGDVRAVNPLIGLLADRGEDVREAARCALVRIGGPAVGPLLAALRETHDWEVYVCELAAQALVQIGGPAVEPLIAALGDEDALVRWTAAESLGKIGDRRAIVPLVAALDARDMRQAALAALEMLGWKVNRPDEGAPYPVAQVQRVGAD
jgi:HEAT repeat protein